MVAATILKSVIMAIILKKANIERILTKFDNRGRQSGLRTGFIIKIHIRWIL